jgi:hypothetical protein
MFCARWGTIADAVIFSAIFSEGWREPASSSKAGCGLVTRQRRVYLLLGRRYKCNDLVGQISQPGSTLQRRGFAEMRLLLEVESQ